MKKYLFIGAGNMAYAIIESMRGADITIYDKYESQYEKFDRNSVKIASNLKTATEESDYIFLSVKPQNFAGLLQDIKSYGLSFEGKTIVSIAAGVSCESICKNLGAEVAVIRTMPNTPLLIGKGVTALSKNSAVTEQAFKDILEVFSFSGEVFELPEEKMNAVVCVTSSSPAYVYYFIDCIYREALSQGINTDNILEIVCEVVKGAADMILKTNKTPDELIKMVCSPNGTTERAMNVLYDRDFKGTLSDAMEACTERAEELSKAL